MPGFASSSKLILVLLGLSIAAAPLKGEELFQRGADEDGLRYWRGARAIELDGERVLDMRLRRTGDSSFHQDVRLRGVDAVAWTMKVRTCPDYDGRRIILRTREGRRSVFTHRPIRSGAQWQEITWDPIDTRGASTLRFEVEAASGNGSLYFKDLSLKDLADN